MPIDNIPIQAGTRLTGAARQKLLDAALSVIRAQGYTATSVDDICAKAGVTKGAFFHHFESKEALAVQAAKYWSEMTGAFFATAPYHKHADPLERVLGYDFRKAILTGKVSEFTCLVGTMVQEVYETCVFLGSKTSAKFKAWTALPEADRKAKEREGMAAWKAWVQKNQSAIVAMGGPLGKTKKITQGGIADVSNEMGAFTVVRAESHEAAAKLFENHPHFAIFPGESVEAMPVLPIPGA